MSRNLLFVSLLGMALFPACVLAADRPPNFVVIFTDDQGYADIGCQGAKGFTTPNIDRMAREGVRFTSFYSAQAVCSASRAALLTGCYPNRIGILGALGPAARHGINDQEMTIGQLLKQKDYATAIYGKWHLGHHPQFLPTRHGFDDYFGLPYSNDMWRQHPTAQFPDLPLVEGEKTIALNPDQTQLTTWYTERAVKFIEKNKQKPFFLYVAHNMPHVPLHVSDKFKGKSERGLFGDVIMEIDWSVGEILGALKKQGIDEQTLVIFTSDNGPWLSYGDHAGSAGPLREGKGTTWDGGQRVPCVMRWPGKIPAGSVCDEPARTIDVFPTLAKLSGAPLPKHKIDGVDIWPLVFGQANAKSPHDALYFYWGRELQAVRSGQWKLHFPHTYRTLAGKPGGKNGKPGKYEEAKTELALYDLANDVGETTNVAEKHPDVVARLKALAARAREDLGDSATKQTGAGVRPAGSLKESSERKPNVIFILADDLGWAELGCYRQKKIRTPCLDRMASQGMRFTQAYSGSPVCAPSRCCLMTGKHGGHAFVRDNREIKPEGQVPIPASEITIAELFKHHGYMTGAIGKWGLGGPGSEGDPLKQGFDFFYGYNCQRHAHNHYPTYLWRNDQRVPLEGNDGGRTGKQFSHDLMEAEALRFIRDNKSKPFFLYLPFIISHVAIQVPEDALNEYKGQWDDPPYDGKKGYQPHPAPRAGYAAMVTRLDRSVGRILDLLKALDLDNDTLVLFTSDNGPTHGGVGGSDSAFFESAGKLRGLKGSVEEGGIRVPLLARWPGKIKPASTSDLPCYFPDVMPTLVDAIGVPAASPKEIDGISFAPTLFGQPQRQKRHEYLLWEFRGYGGQQAVRMGDWKGIRRNLHKGNMKLELYNLKDDPSETSDIAAQQPDVVRQIGEILRNDRVPSREFPIKVLDEKK